MQTTLTAGTRALVTAGAAGIGLATAIALREAGAQVFICDVDEAALDSLRRDQPDITATRCDVADSSAVEQLFNDVRAKLGGLDILVNNAGVAGPTAAVEDVDDADWERTLAVNISGQFYCVKRAVPLLREAGGGSIINLSSAAGRFGFPLRSPYAASKWAVVGFTKSLAMELGPDQIRVNALLPGIVEGARIDRVIDAKAASLDVTPDAMRTTLLENVSMRCMVSPDDIAAMIVFLTSPAGERVSGQALSVDGNVEVLR